jgi:hypothetical protein
MKIAPSKRRIIHEMKEVLVIFLFVAPFVITLATYRMFLVRSTSWSLAYGTALVNALVLAKVISAGELAGLGRRSEQEPLIVPTLHKSVAFTLLYVLFLGLEGIVHGLVHAESLFNALRAAFVTGKRDLLMRGLVAFFAAMPFFALREMRRVLGADAFRSLFFGRGRPRHSDQSMAPSKHAKTPSVSGAPSRVRNQELRAHTFEGDMG